MSEQDAAINGIHRAAQRREKANAERKDATAELRAYVEEARKVGVSITRIASEAGLSRQGVYDLLAARPSA